MQDGKVDTGTSLEQLRAKVRNKNKNKALESTSQTKLKLKTSPLEVIGERPESRSDFHSSKSSFKISPRVDGADVEMMHFALGGDLNDFSGDVSLEKLGGINDFAPSLPKNMAK